MKFKEQIMSNYCKNCYELAEQFYQLKGMNKELERCNERLLQTIAKNQAEIVQKNIDETNILLMKENMDLQKQLDQLKVENESHNNRLEKLHKTLSEIKEIVMGIMDDDLEESSAYYGAKQILQKINECEVK